MTIQKVRLDELIEDSAIYPRGSASDIRVSDLAYALDAGAVLPPPVVDKATRKIVDGYHRTRALRRRLDAEAEIDADVREFADDLAMAKESVRLNASHGLPLGRYDQRVAVLKIRQLGGSDDEIAAALGVTPARLVQVLVRQADSSAGPVPLKRGTEHMGGSYLSDEQVAEIRKMRGAPARSKVRELIRLLQQGLVPVQNDPELRDDLALLAKVITTVLAAQSGR